MKIGIACGGTGGHIFPGLATAEVLRARGHEVTLWLSGWEIEKKALINWSGPMIAAPAMGLPSRPGLRYFSMFAVNCRAFLRCRRQMRLSPPDVFLAMGGYASAAPALAAVSRSIPLVLHEANVIPGRANRFLSRWAKILALGFKETRNHIRHPNMVYTGMPLRGRSAGGKTADWKLLQPEIFTVLVMGGSRGARRLNEVAAQAFRKLQEAGKTVQVIHLTGVEDEDTIRETYRERGIVHLVFSFLHAIEQAYCRAVFVICRAGASTCAELSRYGTPALLVPYPYAAANHQFANARAHAENGAADVIAEKDLTADWLSAYIGALMNDRGKLERMRRAALQHASPDAADALADWVLKTGEEKK
jgi:UDP-N-acetylglucosamine--N-acetylmuramyl-(pentapeptide) pyrophosphoryl-undecaprenol N-acetylglucosamine transferase